MRKRETISMPQTCQNAELSPLHATAQSPIRDSRLRGKGLGAFAIRDIEATTRILYEEPLIVFRKPENAISVLEVERAYWRLSLRDKDRFWFWTNGMSKVASSASLYEIFM